MPGPAGFAPPSAQGSLGRPVPTPAPSAAAQAASTPTPAPSAPWSDAAAAQFAAPGHHAAQTHGPRSSRDRRFWPAVVGSA
ncbi:MAG: hypothetical protein M3Y20_02945, partial [Actinomycetota bacterium]|nr:hypothetical protein [Actinomycetota bacterium]